MPTSNNPFFMTSIVIGTDGSGGYYLLFHSEANDVAVLWVNLDEGWVITDRWSSFADFLDGLLQ